MIIRGLFKVISNNQSEYDYLSKKTKKKTVVLYLKRWHFRLPKAIGRSGERGSGISVLVE